MARISKVTTLTQPIWPDKTIYASVFADQPPTPDHATPQTADPAWNDLITDYISSTDSSVQTIASALGLGVLGSATNDVFKISPPSGWSPTAIGSLDNLVEFNMNGFTMPTAPPTTLRILGVAGTTNIAAGTTLQIQGLAFFPTIAFGANGGTLSNLNSVITGASLTATAAFTLTNLNGINNTMSLNANGTYTTVKGIANTLTPAGTATTVVGLDLVVGAGGTVTNRIAIRDTSTTSTSRLNSKLRLGDQTAPVMQLENTGGLGVHINTVTTTYQALTSDDHILADATAGIFTVTLPTSSGSFNTNVGQRIHIKKKDSSVNAVTIAPSGADTIEGVTSLNLTAQYNSRTLYTDGSGIWFVEAST